MDDAAPRGRSLVPEAIYERLLATRRRRGYVQTVVAGYGYTGVATAVNLALIPILVGGLGKASYGTWLTTAALVQWGTVVTGWLSPGFVKQIGDRLAGGQSTDAAHVVANVRRFYRAGGALVVAVGIVLAMRPELGLGGESGPELRATILVATAWLVFQVEAQVEVAILIATQRLYMVNLIQAIVLLASGTGAATLVIAGFGLPAVAMSYATAAGAGLVAYKLSRRRHFAFEDSVAPLQRAMLRELLSSTSPYALAILGWILLSSDIVLLSLMTSPEVVATYGIAYKVVETMVQVIWRVADSAQPYIVELNALGDREGLRRLYYRTNEATLMLSGCLAGAFFFWGDRLLVAWVGAEQAADVSVVRMLCVYAVLLALVRASVIFPFSVGRMHAIGRLQVLEGIAKVMLAIPLVGLLGSVGVVTATVSVVVALSLWYAPLFTWRLLEIDGRRFVGRLTRQAALVPTVTVLVAWLTSELVPHDHPAVTLLVTALVAVAGAGAGVGLAAIVRSRSV